MNIVEILLIYFLPPSTMSTVLPETHPPTEGLPQSCLVPINQVPKQRHPYGSKKQAVRNVGSRIVTPAGVFAQVISTSGNPASVSHVPLEEEVEMEVDAVDGGVPVVYVGAGDGQLPQGGTTGDGAQGGSVEDDEERKRAHKKERQWRKWSEDVIPVLLKPYLTLMRETQSLRNIESVRGKKGCVGCTLGRLLEISCIYFNRKLSLLVSIHLG